jgi:hypothetical protein
MAGKPGQFIGNEDMFRQSGPGRYRYLLFALVFTLLTPSRQAFARAATLSIVTGAFSAEGKASTPLPDFLFALTPELFWRIGKMVNQEALTRRLTTQQLPLFSTGMHLYLHKKHAALVPRLAQALKGMKADGSYLKIQDATLNRATTP